MERQWLKKIRLSQKLSQYDVAKKAKLTRPYYGFIESGKRGVALPVPTAKKIALVLGFDWQKFYEPDDEQAVK